MKFLILLIFSFFFGTFGQSSIVPVLNSDNTFPQPINETNGSLIIKQTGVSIKVNVEKDIMNLTLNPNSSIPESSKIFSNSTSLNDPSTIFMTDTQNLTLGINNGENSSKTIPQKESLINEAITVFETNYTDQLNNSQQDKLEPLKNSSNNISLNDPSGTIITNTQNLTFGIISEENSLKNTPPKKSGTNEENIVYVNNYTKGISNSHQESQNTFNQDGCSDEETKYVLIKITSKKDQSFQSDSPLSKNLTTVKKEEKRNPQKNLETENDLSLSSNNEISNTECVTDNSMHTQNNSYNISSSVDAFQTKLDENVKYMPVTVISNKKKMISPKSNPTPEFDDLIEMVPSKASSRQQKSSLISINNHNLPAQPSNEELSDDAQHFQNYYSKYFKRYYEKLRSFPGINPPTNLYKYMPLMYANYDNSILDSPAVFHPSNNPQCPCTNNKAVFCDCDELNIKNIPKAETIVLPIIQPIIQNRIINPTQTTIDPIDPPCDIEEGEECGCEEDTSNQDSSFQVQANNKKLRKNLRFKQIKKCCDCESKNINNANMNNANLLSQKNTLNKIGSVVANNYSTINYNKHIHNFINGADFKFKADNYTENLENMKNQSFKEIDIKSKALTVNQVKKLMDADKFENEENCTKYIVPPIKVENILTDIDQTEKVLTIKNKIPKRIINKIITKKQYEELEPIIFSHENFTGVMNQAIDNTIFDVKRKRLKNQNQNANKKYFL